MLAKEFSCWVVTHLMELSTNSVLQNIVRKLSVPNSLHLRGGEGRLRGQSQGEESMGSIPIRVSTKLKASFSFLTTGRWHGGQIGDQIFHIPSAEIECRHHRVG